MEKNMRDILFRGKRKTIIKSQNGKWIFGYLSSKDFIHADYGKVKKGELKMDGCPVYSETIGQYVGMKDKNGTMIFEGDVIQYLNTTKENTIAVISFKKGSFTSKVIDKDIPPHPIMLTCGKNCEIIGNIYDNPNFITGGKKNEKTRP
jgi:uncharacterized phage protein (TIGR01671 family)